MQAFFNMNSRIFRRPHSKVLWIYVSIKHEPGLIGEEEIIKKFHISYFCKEIFRKCNSFWSLGFSSCITLTLYGWRLSNFVSQWKDACEILTCFVAFWTEILGCDWNLSQILDNFSRVKVFFLLWRFFTFKEPESRNCFHNTQNCRLIQHSCARICIKELVLNCFIWFCWKIMLNYKSFFAIL